MRLLLVAVLAAAALGLSSPTAVGLAVPRPAGCNTDACTIRVMWRHYQAHPMPACTWEPESSWDPATHESFHGRPWAVGRYRVVNPSSGAGGKFQFLPSTWRGIGGRGLPQNAPRVDQEHYARKLRRLFGLRPWVNCPR